MPRKRKISEIVEEARQLPYGERTELIEQLIADTAKSHQTGSGLGAWGAFTCRLGQGRSEGYVFQSHSLRLCGFA